MIKDFLPISKEDMIKRGWDQCDFVFVTGDAYVDHPSFGPAIISRLLESHGYKVGMIAQPDWKDSNSITVLGEPKLGFLVSGGNMDSMVNHYTVAKKRRQTDSYSPGGQMGLRPDHATVVYGNLIRKRYKHIPIIIGGIEASLRRLAHYDYWGDKVKRSILLDSQADLISYGMGEHSIVEIAEALSSGIEVKDITYINGTVFKTKSLDTVYEGRMLPDYESILESKEEFAKSFYIQYLNTDPYTGKRLIEKYKDHEFVVQNPPSKPLTQMEMDRVYSLFYMRDYHPNYQEAGGIPAIEEVKFSLISNRGCFGGCNYCALTFHQGRIVQTRSHESIVAEAGLMVWDKDFKGYIHDVGGPTANFRHVACEKQNTKGACVNKQCLYPTPCKSLKIDHTDYLDLLRKLRELPNVKKVFIRSGIRFDYLTHDKDDTFMRELCEHHVSGQLKVAPEHISDSVLKLMGKPENSVYEEFLSKYKKTNEKLGKNQFVVPYLISSHPGSTLKEAIELAEYLRDLGYMPEQVQDFYPTPSTISTCMYYTGLDPRTMKMVYVPKSPHEKAMQRALIQYRNPKNYNLVVEALTKAGRTDLIGFDKHCLVRPRQLAKEKQRARAASHGEKYNGKKEYNKKSKTSEQSNSQVSKSKTKIKTNGKKTTPRGQKQMTQVSKKLNKGKKQYSKR
ncbi:YgiQ family radical SAM protein [Mobilitalea sibirica]|uniref:YgiQ family radical SAM protein n=1 Tax=Mobilitalea sibirica TaxID=1462919 RepID=A0A8J7L0D1_9FIRM|nr:YgiQ family radical SAM protein [Mobilitalea sibirica]MBH1942078.1 YgiQ family radical SAM protein [Mobilitalea sibirica]